MKRGVAAVTAVIGLVLASTLTGQVGHAATSGPITVERTNCTSATVTYAGAGPNDVRRANLILDDGGSPFYTGAGDPQASTWKHTFADVLPTTTASGSVWMMASDGVTVISTMSFQLLGCGAAVTAKLSAPICADNNTTFPWAVAHTGTSGEALFELKLNDVVVDSRRLGPGQSAKGQYQVTLPRKQAYSVSLWVDGQQYGEAIANPYYDCSRLVPMKPSQVKGSYRVGTTMRIVHGTYRPTPTSYRYQWWRYDNVVGARTVIPGANKQTYTITAADRGYDITGLELPVRKGYPGHWTGPGANPVRG